MQNFLEGVHHTRPERKKASITLVKQSVIDCTVLPFRDDSELQFGIALATLNNFDTQ